MDGKFGINPLGFKRRNVINYIKEISVDKERFSADNERLSAENEKLSAENEQLRSEVNSLIKALSKASEDTDTLKEQLKHLLNAVNE